MLFFNVAQLKKLIHRPQMKKERKQQHEKEKKSEQNELNSSQ
jgi:hypothetical protein